MGLLTVGTPLSWQDTKKYADTIRKRGIKQFINIHRKLLDRKNDCLRWGDEVEFTLVKFDHKNKRCYLLLKADEALPALQAAENRGEKTPTLWRPEYANYMVEGTPGSPYEHQIQCFNRVEANMRLRRKQVQDILGEDEFIVSVTAFPRLGCDEYTWPSYPAGASHNEVSRSIFWTDRAIYPGHPRFKSLTRNIRERRGEKVSINVPVYLDQNTLEPVIEATDNERWDDESKKAMKPFHIYLDAMGFGMGCSCLQMTFQAQSLEEARHLYDQLTPLTPIMLALSAASPIWRGFLSDVDCRWNVISASCDDRTAQERGEAPLDSSQTRFVIPKSRYASISTYLSPENTRYNDLPLVKDDELFAELVENGIDSAMANHVSHLFIRDPLVVFEEKLDIDDQVETDHFENIQSTNWQTMRFKPPPLQSSIGWRVEFRPSEVQITDFENAAFVTFLVLFTRALLSFKLNTLIPISKVDTNLERAQKRDACLNQKFFFRRNIHTDSSGGPDDPEIVEMSVNEIVNGSERFPGCVHLIKDYLSNLDVDVDTQCTIKQYLSLIEARASGKLMTTAAWMRKFVTTHPAYKDDSLVTDEINYDLMWRVHLIATGQIKCPDLLFPYQTKSSE